jgi:hypothetical protein
MLCVRPASFLGALRISTCDVFYKTADGTDGTIRLLHNYLESPIIIVPSLDGKALLCLYDSDPGLMLLKVNTDRIRPPYAQTGELASIVVSCPWEVREGGRGDWQKILQTLESMPVKTFRERSVPGLDLGYWRIYREQKLLLPRIRRRIESLGQAMSPPMQEQTGVRSSETGQNKRQNRMALSDSSESQTGRISTYNIWILARHFHQRSR